MAHLWVEQEAEQDAEARQATHRWAIASLDGNGDVFFLTGDRDRPVALTADGSAGAAYVIRHAGPQGEKWMLFAAPAAGVFLNGAHLALGMRVLRDRDEIRLGGCGRMIFSTERQARVEPFAGIGKPAKCPRCQQTIAEGTPAVRCPRCGVWHHQDEAAGLPCWTYAETCTLCDQPTALDAGFRWTPEDG